MTTSKVSTECLIVGGGVVGLSCAASIAKKGIESIVIESESHLCQHTSSHNSEIIHAGIYYKKDSLKAKLCLEGNKLLYEYCLKRGINFKKIGKLIILSQGESISQLEKVYSNAINNGVEEISMINNKKLIKLEPNLNSESAIFSGTTGIIDSHAFALSLQEEIASLGGHIITNAPLLSGAKNKNGWSVEVGGLSPCIVDCNFLINASGFNATSIGKSLGIETLPDPHFVLGHYYSYKGPSPFNHLIYPIPTKGGLGIHTTIDLSGKTRFGPDSEHIEQPSYRFKDTKERKEKFYKSIRKYFHDFKEDFLMPDFCGIRVRLQPNHADADFSILSPKEHSLEGLINIAGIESPGLTSSLAIGRYVSSFL